MAWAENISFPGMEGADDEAKASIVDFPPRIKAIAANIPIRNHGPFPLVHDDFAHNNIVVDDAYNILGIIDWEHASSMPWETVYFPLTLSVLPPPMMPAWMYENGVPKNEKTRVRISERQDYMDEVCRVEKREGLSHSLSAALGDEAGQQLAYAMRLYAHDGKHGYYSKILDAHHRRWGQLSQIVR